jgi:hypothetical protein
MIKKSKQNNKKIQDKAKTKTDKNKKQKQDKNKNITNRIQTNVELRFSGRVGNICFITYLIRNNHVGK